MFKLAESVKHSFSLSNNLHDLFCRDKHRCAYIDGLRAIAILLLILFHLLFYMQFFLSPSTNLAMSTNHSLLLIYNSQLGVDIFFVISGYLIASILLQEFEEYGRINIKRFYFRRYLRLTPLYYLMLLVCTFFLKNNINNLWISFTYLQNFIPFTEIYMPWSWSLAVEEQFYLLFPLVFLILLRYTKKHFTILLFSFVLSIVIIIYVVISNNLTLPIHEHLVLSPSRFSFTADTYYIRTHTRFGAFIPGIIMAYINFKYYKKVEGILVYGVADVIVFFLSILLILPALLTRASYSNDEFSFIYNIAYFAFFKYLLAIGIGLIILLASHPVTRLASIINTFLSWRVWYVIAQISYAVFLINPLVMILFYESFLTDALMESNFQMGLLFLAILSTITFLSMLSFLFIEKPFMNMRPYFESDSGTGASQQGQKQDRFKHD